jgi:hypothetical protein
LDLSRRVGRGDIWRRQWELLENRVYNKPNGCNATGALAPGPDLQEQRQPGALIYHTLFWNETLHVSDSSSVHHQEFFTVQTACEQDQDGTLFHPDLLTSCLQTRLTYTIAVCTVKN